MASNKKRLDVLLVELGLCESREKAKGLILSGMVMVNGARADKVGNTYPNDCDISVIAPAHNYVSRGGLKLEKALSQLGVSVQGKTILDIGASTGGFTDCALQNGAEHVIAVDVGTGQLAWKLRNDPRVTVMEKTNARYLTSEMLVRQPDTVTIDVSFISLKLILPTLAELLSPSAEVVALIKPQFEAGKEIVSRGKGVVRDKDIHLAVVKDIINVAENLGWALRGLTFSPITGPEGNIEFISWWSVTGIPISSNVIHQVVVDAHKELGL